MIVVIPRQARPSWCICRQALARAKATLACPEVDTQTGSDSGGALAALSSALGFSPTEGGARVAERVAERVPGVCPFTAGPEELPSAPHPDETDVRIPGACPFSAPGLEETTTTTTTTTAALKSYAEIPGPRGLPLIGNALKYSKLGPYSFEKILDNRFSYIEKYGKIYKEKLGTMNIVHLFDPADIAAMFRQEGKHPSRGTIANLEVTYLKRNDKLIGFAFQDGEEWARQRGKIQKLMMHPTAATRYLHWQNPVARDFADYLGNKRDGDNVVQNLYDDLFKYTMETIGAVCFGERLGSFGATPTEDAGRLSSAIAETFFCFRNCMFSFPWYQYFRTPLYRRFEVAANTMREIMGRHVREVESRMRVGAHAREACPFSADVTEEGRSVFEVLMADDGVSEELGVNLIMALLRTGIDSTGNALAFFLYNLATNPDKQELLYREIQEVVPEGAPVTAEALQKMSYLKAALRESFRLHFPVFGGSGRVMPKDMNFSGYNVPKGTFIFANMATMSRMPEYYPEPEAYHPERWLRDERASMRTEWTEEPGHLSLPFSHGMRACPGKRFAEQGLYLAVVAIIQKHKLSYNKEKMGMIHMPFTTPDKPLDIQFTPRQ